MELVSSEWLAHQHRDTLSSIVGHPTLTSFLAIADGEAIGRVKFEMTEVRLRESVVQWHAYGYILEFISSVCSNPVDLLLRKTTIKHVDTLSGVKQLEPESISKSLSPAGAHVN